MHAYIFWRYIFEARRDALHQSGIVFKHLEHWSQSQVPALGLHRCKFPLHGGNLRGEISLQVRDLLVLGVQTILKSIQHGLNFLTNCFDMTGKDIAPVSHMSHLLYQ